MSNGVALRVLMALLCMICELEPPHIVDASSPRVNEASVPFLKRLVLGLRGLAAYRVGICSIDSALEHISTHVKRFDLRPRRSSNVHGSRAPCR